MAGCICPDAATSLDRGLRDIASRNFLYGSVPWLLVDEEVCDQNPRIVLAPDRARAGPTAGIPVLLYYAAARNARDPSKPMTFGR